MRDLEKLQNRAIVGLVFARIRPNILVPPQKSEQVCVKL